MDFTVLGKTPEGCSSLYACHVEETDRRGEGGSGTENWNKA